MQSHLQMVFAVVVFAAIATACGSGSGSTGPSGGVPSADLTSVSGGGAAAATTIARYESQADAADLPGARGVSKGECRGYVEVDVNAGRVSGAAADVEYIKCLATHLTPVPTPYRAGQP